MPFMKYSLAIAMALALGSTEGFTSNGIKNKIGTRPASALDSTTNKNEDEGRRAFLLASGGLASVSVVSPANAFFGWFQKPKSQGVDYKKVASDIDALIKEHDDWGPTLVRLAWHSSGTYDKMTKTGGSQGGTMRFKEEFNHGANAGLKQTAITWLDEVYEKNPGISYADLYTLGGVVAIKSLNGPTIPWSSGRVDEMDPSAVTPDGRLPNADSGKPGADPSDADHLRQVFGRMGFDDKEIVCLSGAHALGRCHEEFSGYVGPWTATPTTFNNLYYRFLIGQNWTPKDWTGKFQYVAGGGMFMMLPTDLVLIQDDAFKQYVDEYAKDQDKFFKDFTKAFQKLEELGTKDLKPTEWA